MSQQNKPVAKVINFSEKKHARLTLSAFDKIEHEDKRIKKEGRAEVERKSRNTF
ncbi:hypothetical protein AAKU64_003999 [Undibacterium sp. GrIS 1.8]|uniref:hypothetical protein n=1 Tax=Undibacterium sp. GrIS 1.8 TaxID=3143934 RepID=UPI003399583A